MKHILLKSLAVTGLAACCVFTGYGKASAPKANNGELTVAEMNQALRMMARSPMGIPKTVDELTNFPTVKGRSLPTPPAGKKFAINPVTCQIIIVNQ